MKHLLKTPWEKIAPGRNKSKHYFRPVFAYDLRLLFPICVPPTVKVSLRDQVPFEKLGQIGALAKTEVLPSRGRSHPYNSVRAGSKRLMGAFPLADPGANQDECTSKTRKIARSASQKRMKRRVEYRISKYPSIRVPPPAAIKLPPRKEAKSLRQRRHLCSLNSGAWRMPARARFPL